MVIQFVKQYAKQVLKQRAKKYVTQEFGHIAGGIAGIAISAGSGDYYGAVRDIGDIIRGGKPDKRNPPFGYYNQGDETLDGASSSSLGETLRSVQFKPSSYSFKRQRKDCTCGRKYYCKPCRRSRRRNNH